MKLSQFQIQLSDRILGEPGGRVSAVESEKYASAIDIYRNNYRGGLASCLRSSYTNLEKVIGEDGFNIISKRFVRENPPQASNINLYGEEFSEFLMTESQLKDHPYLKDFTQFEWVWNRILYAPGEDPLARELLGEIAARDPSEVAFRFRSGCEWFYSEYPILNIWNDVQEGDETRFDVNKELEDSTRVVVAHLGQARRLFPFSLEESVVLEGIDEGESLEQLTSRAHSRGVDILPVLIRLIELELIQLVDGLDAATD